MALANGSYASAFQGMTLWWGTGHDWTSYREAYRGQVAFARQIGWYGFLQAYNAGHGPGPAEPPDPKLDRADYGLTDITFTDADHGWAAGYDNVSSQAIIVRTTDGGRHWTTKSPSWWYAYTVSSLSFLDARRGWAVGSEGYDGSLILKTTDGGRSWAWQSGKTAEYLLGADAVDASRVWVAGSNGTLLNSGDGGRHWSGVRRSSQHGPVVGRLRRRDARLAGGRQRCREHGGHQVHERRWGELDHAGHGPRSGDLQGPGARRRAGLGRRGRPGERRRHRAAHRRRGTDMGDAVRRSSRPVAQRCDVRRRLHRVGGGRARHGTAHDRWRRVLGRRRRPDDPGPHRRVLHRRVERLDRRRRRGRPAHAGRRPDLDRGQASSRDSRQRRRPSCRRCVRARSWPRS